MIWRFRICHGRKKKKLIVEGNALYEIDMECVEHKKDRMRDMKNGGFRKKRRDTEKKGAGEIIPGAFWYDHYPQMEPHPPQQKSRRIISRQQLSPPNPPPQPPPQPQLSPLPQQQRSRMIQIMELHPPPPKQELPESHPESHPHPQFVAAKSLM